VIVTSDGIVSQYLLGIEYPPQQLSDALKNAAAHRRGSLVQNLLLLCYCYDPATGRYTLLISRVIQVACAGTVLALGGGFALLHFARRKHLASLP